MMYWYKFLAKSHHFHLQHSGQAPNSSNPQYMQLSAFLCLKQSTCLQILIKRHILPLHPLSQTYYLSKATLQAFQCVPSLAKHG